jgi:hypothetical protein
MKSLLCILGTFVCIATAAADDYRTGPRLGGDPAPAPFPLPGTSDPIPVPRASYQVVPGDAESGASYSVPMPPIPTVESYNAGAYDPAAVQSYSPALPEGTYSDMVIEGAPLPATMGVALYPNVRVNRPHNIDPCAVPTIIQVPDPCNPNCCVYIEVCFPTCTCPQVSVGPFGRRVRFDFGHSNVLVWSKANGVIAVNYN